MANEEDLLKAAAHPQRGNAEPMQTSFLFIMSHAWASAYAKIGNSNKKTAQPPTSLLDGLAGLRVWHISTKTSGMKLLPNWSRYWQAEAELSCISKRILLPPRYVSVSEFQFQLCWYSRCQCNVIVHSLAKHQTNARIKANWHAGPLHFSSWAFKMKQVNAWILAKGYMFVCSERFLCSQIDLATLAHRLYGWQSQSVHHFGSDWNISLSNYLESLYRHLLSLDAES